jgi:hypothetical protein
MSKITITEVRDQWLVSRPTIMKAVKAGKVSGEKDEKGKWIFDPAEIVRWRGEPGGDRNGDIQVYSKPDTSSENPLQTVIIEILRAQVHQLDGHLKTKDDQIEKLQDTLRDHTKLLEMSSKPGLWKRIFG